MKIDEKIERSKSQERIDFNAIGCDDNAEPLVPLQQTDTLRIDPIWNHASTDIEGELYAAYIKEYPEYATVYVRATLREMLQKASELLPKNMALVVHAGHRPIAVQRALLQMVADDYQTEHPETTAEEALEHARMYVSDPAIKLPPHCCGAAVDVEIIDTSTGELLEFGTSINVDNEQGHLHATNISNEARANRLLLLRCMLEVGFCSLYSEWWHFSYGDQNWAWFYRHDNALYGLVEPQL